MAEVRTKASNWTVEQEIALVQSVQDGFSALYGSFKGSSRGKERRMAAWTEVAGIVNA